MGSAGENWGQWLYGALEAKSYRVTMPTLPNADHPDRRAWLQTVAEYMQTLGNDTIIVAHSLSVASALDYLEIAESQVAALVSVSGFANDYGLELNSYFLKEKVINFGAVDTNLERAFVLYGDDDSYVPQEVLRALATDLNVEPTIIPHGGHLNTAAGFTEFPKLLETILSV
jgi:predicted alpha/beta hydrolase family esterase